MSIKTEKVSLKNLTQTFLFLSIYFQHFLWQSNNFFHDYLFFMDFHVFVLHHFPPSVTPFQF